MSPSRRIGLVLTFAVLAVGALGSAAGAGGARAASAATLYVDNTDANATDTSNDCQTQATPCATISHAVDLAVAMTSTAATIDVVAGDYDEAVTISGVPTSSTLAITGGSAGVTVTAPTGNSVFTANGPGGKITLSHLTISGGQTSGSGGGLHDNFAGVNLIDDTFSGNSAPSGGGGALDTGGGNLIVGTTFVNNSASGSGGAINNGGGITVIDDTFVNNTAGNNGGAIISSTAATIGASTFVGNQAASGGAIYNFFNATISNDVFADGAGAGANCVDNPINGGSGVTDAGHNVSDGSDCGMSAANNDVVDASEAAIGLGPLQDNGGPTETAAIGAGSVAADEVPAASCTPAHASGTPSNNQPLVDQRGVPRPQPPSSACDAGAYEYAPPAVTSVSPAGGQAGATVTITGSGLTLASGVAFGPNPAASFTVDSDTQITATAPSGSGTVDITVTNPDGTSPAVSGDEFTYAVPPPPPAPTSLTAAPAVLELLPHISVLAGPSATLTSNGAPVADATIVFTTSAGKQICTARTDGSGTAGCGSGQAVATLGTGDYKAAYAGDDAHEPSSATGSIVVVNGTKVL